MFQCSVLLSWRVFASYTRYKLGSRSNRNGLETQGKDAGARHTSSVPVWYLFSTGSGNPVPILSLLLNGWRDKYTSVYPHGLTFTRWGCCNRACQLLFILFLCLFLSLWPFQLYFIPYILPPTLRFLTLFFRSYFCLISPFNYISVYESIPQPWYNPLWLTGLKVPTNYLTH